MKSSALEITLKEFMAIAEIPRPSHHEEKIGAYLVEWAQKRGLTVEQDAIGDVIIDKPAAPGHERAPLVIIQAHMDKPLNLSYRVFISFSATTTFFSADAGTPS